ncbi:MAG: DNA polymerase II large subunit [Promethearchaeota archaeon]|nr:MAG: DNA polymerase II large subunit [Candidatus Lokiarchaeota archaeon]
MPDISKAMEIYFNQIQKQVDQCYSIAEQARQKGLDPELDVESPQAKDLAGRVEKLVGPQGVADVIRELKMEGLTENELVFKVVSDILDKKIGNIESLEDRVDRAIRVGLAIKTMGVVSAPLEGISKILIRKDTFGRSYLSLYFAGPIRAAGGTTAALCVLIADYVRRKSNIPKYEATEAEIGRYVEEIKLYDRLVHLQYPSSNPEIRFAVSRLPVEINGDSTEDEEVSAFRDLPRIGTNNIRGGACLVLNDGILLKAPKLLNIANAMNLEGWDWLAELKKVAQKQEKKKDIENKEAKKEIKIPPNSKYVADIIAGRPVFSHPSKIGGHRIRYGRSRNTGLAAGGIHPATMVILDEFIAIGTQLRIERPGKSTSVCPVNSIEPPIVKLKNGNVIKVSDIKKAKKIFPEIKKILFLGDLLFGFGEFTENNHKLVPSGYVEEWWALELENSIREQDKIDEKIKDFINNPFKNIPTAEEAIKISKKFSIPLHPRYLDFWGNLSIEELDLLRNAFIKNFSESEQNIKLTYEKPIKKILENAFVLHKLKDNKILFSKEMSLIYKSIFNLKDKKSIKIEQDDNVFTYFNKISSLQIKNKAPYFMGSRMGRPEKSERKSMKGIHTLFPLSDVVGSSRLIEKAMGYLKRKNNGSEFVQKNRKSVDFSSKNNIVEAGRINIDVCRKKCPKCGKATIFNLCPDCGAHTEVQKICQRCKLLYPTFKEICSKCHEPLKTTHEAKFNIRQHVKSVLRSLNIQLPKNFKGIIGLTNEYKVPEPIEKGILRAKNNVLVYKTAEIRYDATDIPLTHFKPKEIETPIEILKELGYIEDINGIPLKEDDQILELKVQDVILSKDCGKYFTKVANFLDDELELFYEMTRFYNVSVREDLIGHLIVGLAPHTSAGIIGRIIGFTPARAIYAHPFWHASKRRNCDGDEDGVMLLLDPLLNFSRHYLPSKIGGRMDATLVIGTKIDPNEIDVEAHNIDTLYKYPLEFYEVTKQYTVPSKIEAIMNLVKSRLGTSKQYEQIGYNIPTDNINEGPTVTAYKLYESMDDKIEAQLNLAKLIKSVKAKKVAEKVLTTHFNPDILGNLRKFAVQGFRCVKCNEKFRRPPLTNSGKCPKCGNRVILTVNRGGIEKYIPRALKLCNDFNLDKYTKQRMELIEEYVESLTDNPKIKQHKLSDFF